MHTISNILTPRLHDLGKGTDWRAKHAKKGWWAYTFNGHESYKFKLFQSFCILSSPNTLSFKGEVMQKKILAQSFYRTLSPKLIKNQVEGFKIDQIRTKRPTATVSLDSCSSYWPELVDFYNRCWPELAVWVLFLEFLTLWHDFWPTSGLFCESCLLRLILFWGQYQLWAVFFCLTSPLRVERSSLHQF